MAEESWCDGHVCIVMNGVLTIRQFNGGERSQVLMPLSTEQRCLIGLGEWQQYCSNIGDDISRANHLLSWDYVAPGCRMRPMDPEVVIEAMIHEGGWSLIGDSLTREVTCSLSVV
jgi:hypothetical protein